jgi:hypothetical protein
MGVSEIFGLDHMKVPVAVFDEAPAREWISGEPDSGT